MNCRRLERKINNSCITNLLRSPGTETERRDSSCAFIREPNHLIQKHTKKEKREIYCLLCIVVPYPIRYCTYAVSMDRQQQQQQQPREKRKVYWYYYHLYCSPRTMHNLSHPVYNTDSDIIANGCYTVIRVSSHPHQHDTII